MIKLVYCLARRDDVAPEAFYLYWREKHAAKVKARQKALRATKYIQSYTVEAGLNDMLQQSRGLKPPYDGITEVWWDSVDDMKAALETSAGRQAMQELAEDEATFIDLARSRVFMTEERTVF